MTTRKAVFLSFVFFLFVLIVPQLCAQTVSMSADEAAVARKRLVEYSKQFIGKPYSAGGIGPNSFDCSGLIFTVSREAIGVQLPRTTKAIYQFATEISDSEREAGDLVFFKTTSSGEISHVALYIGNNQFIHAASDGPNTGVILSSLKESYWKAHYAGTRRYLPASHSDLLVDSTGTNSNETSTAQASSGGSRTYSSSGTNSFISSLIFDINLAIGWNFFTPDYFRLNWRGIDSLVHVRYAGNTLQPGIGTYIRYDAGTKNVQIPIVFSLTLSDYARIFAGPVISFGTPGVPGNSDEKIENSVFPGILGVCWNTPSFKAGKALISVFQDIHYTVFNKSNGGALSPKKSISSGLVFSTGIRVTLPLKNLL